MSSFEELGVNKWLVHQCKSMGFFKPTEIQARCIMPILEGCARQLTITVLGSGWYEVLCLYFRARLLGLRQDG